jgi:hypothetical protein
MILWLQPILGPRHLPAPSPLRARSTERRERNRSCSRTLRALPAGTRFPALTCRGPAHSSWRRAPASYSWLKRTRAPLARHRVMRPDDSRRGIRCRREASRLRDKDEKWPEKKEEASKLRRTLYALRAYTKLDLKFLFWLLLLPLNRPSDGAPTVRRHGSGSIRGRW